MTTTPRRQSSEASLSSSEFFTEQQEGTPQLLSRKLQLRLHALNLPRSKLLKLPPSSYCVVKFVADPFSKQTTDWGTTEIVPKSCHPQYTTPLLLENYQSGSECYFLVQVHKEENDNTTSSTLGSALFEVSDILGTKNNTKVKRLQQGGGCIFAHLEPLLEHDDEQHALFRFQMRAMELFMRGSSSANNNNSHSFWNATGPTTILELAKQQVLTIGNSWIAVYRSSPVYDSYQPTWDEAEIDLAVCCNGDLQCPIRVSVWQQKKGRANRLIGVFETTVSRLMDACLEDDGIDEEESEKDFILYKPSSKRTEVGRLRVIQAKLYSSNERQSERSVEQAVQESYALETTATTQQQEQAPAHQTAPAVTFQDYIDSGCDIDLCVAIDFTSSNGNPLQAGTLHYQSPESLNDYEEAITSIGESLAVYSRSKAFPVWGFGAKFGGTVRHIFQCGPTNTAQDVDGMLEAYHSVFQSELIMSGPTIIDQVIQAAAVRARNYHQEMILQRKYCVLVILTDGTVDNIEETQRKLAVYRDLPLTVIIVGIGRADFRVMKSLATDNENATFVAFRQHQHNPSSLAEAALSDVPRQIVNYMTRNRIEPTS